MKRSVTLHGDYLRFGINSVRAPSRLPKAPAATGDTSVSDAEPWLARLLNRFGSPNWVSTTHVCNWHKDTGRSYTGVLPTWLVARCKAIELPVSDS